MLFCLLNYIIIYSNIVFVYNCWLFWLYKHSFQFIFGRWVHSLIKIFNPNRWFKQTHCVRYFNMIHSRCYIFLPVNIADTMCYLIYWVKVGYISPLTSILSRLIVLAIPQLLIRLWIIIWLVKKAYTMCWKIHSVKVGYFWLFKICLIRHTMLAIPRWLIHLCVCILPVQNSDTMCYLIYCVKVGYFCLLKVV